MLTAGFWPQRYNEAAQHILDALALQESDSVRNPDGSEDIRGITSTALWDSLKTCSLHLGRLDLATICDQRDIDGTSLPFLEKSEKEPLGPDHRRPHQRSA